MVNTCFVNPCIRAGGDKGFPSPFMRTLLETNERFASILAMAREDGPLKSSPEQLAEFVLQGPRRA